MTGSTFLAGVLCTALLIGAVGSYLDHQQQRAVIEAARENCTPLPGERTVIANDNGVMSCTRTAQPAHQKRGWLWPTR